MPLFEFPIYFGGEQAPGTPTSESPSRFGADGGQGLALREEGFMVWGLGFRELWFSDFLAGFTYWGSVGNKGKYYRGLFYGSHSQIIPC